MKKVWIVLLVLSLTLTGLAPALAEEEPYVIEVMTTNSQWEMSNETDIGKYLEEQFGIVFKNIYYAGDIREKQSTNLAAGEIGEIVYMQRNDMVSAYYNAGVLLCLEDYLEQMPNFAERYVEQLDRWRAPTGGKLYKWETNTPNTKYESMEVLIRSDLLELNDWQMPDTASEMVALLEKAMATYPTTVDGLPAVGMTMQLAEAWGLQGIACIGYEKGGKYLSIGNEGVVFNWVDDQFEDYFLCPDSKESLKFFNTLYQKGLLDVECFTDFSTQTFDKACTGQAMVIWYGNIDVNSANTELRNAGLEQYEYVKTYMQLDSQAANGEKRSYKIETARPFDSWALTTSCKDPQRLIELIDWACTNEGQTILQGGFEGDTYTIGEDGKRVPTEKLLNSTVDERVAIGLSQFSFLPMDKSQNSQDGQYFDLLSEQIYQDQVSLSERQKEVYANMGYDYSTQWADEHGVFVDTGYSGSVSLDSTSELGKIQQQMVDCRLKYSSRLIMANSDEEFESIWEEAVAEYDLLDHQSVVDEYNRLYQELKAQ